MMHKLQKQIINATYYNEAGVNRFYDRALHLFYQDLQPEMEGILNKHAEAHQLITINQLTINLGLTYESDLRSQWVSRFKEEFEKELINKIQHIKNGQAAPGESIQALAANNLDILMFFLTTGTLPWHKNAASATVNTLFDRMLIDIPAELDKRIRAESQKETMIQRLVFQFSDQQIEQLIKVMQPSESTFIIQSAAELRKKQQKNKILKTGKREFRDAIWKFMLTYIINQRGSYFNTREFIGSVLHHMAMHFNVGFAWLIQEIFKSLQQLQPEPVHFSLGMILQELYSTEKSGKRIPTQAETGHRQIMMYLSDGKTKNRATTSPSYTDLFSDWIQAAPLDVREFIRRNAHPELLRRLTDILPEKEMRQFIHVIAPAEATFVTGLHQEIAKQQDAHQWIKSDNKQFQSDFWMVLLDLLLVDRGSFFNQKIFVMAALEKLSAHFNLRASFFIEQILLVLETQAAKFNSTYLLAIFTEIKSEMSKQKSKKNSTEKTRRKAHFQYLESLISGKTNPSKSEHATIQADGSLAQKAAIDYLILKDAVALKNWMIQKLKTSEDIIRFSQASDVRQMRKLINLLNNSFSSRLPVLINSFLQLNQRQSALPSSINEFELYRAAFVFLLTAGSPVDSEARLTAFIIKFLAKKQGFSEIHFVQSLMTESEDNGSAFPKKTRQFLYTEFNVASLSKQTQTEEKAAQLLSEKEIKKGRKKSIKRKSYTFHSAEELNRWLHRKLKTIQQSDMNQLHKILAFYFNNVKENKWEAQCFPNFSTMDLLNRSALAEQIFLDGYLSDLEKILKSQKSGFQGITQDWIRIKIWQLWAGNRHFNQQGLTSFLINEMSMETKTPADRLQTDLFEKARSMQKALSSTLILELGKTKSTITSTKSEIDKMGFRDEQADGPLEGPFEESIDETGEEELNAIYIDNAGLVLLSPFIPVLFERAGLIHEQSFINKEKKQYAIHLLQYCVNNDENSPEYMLTLPKLLCGDELSVPIKKQVRLADKDKELVNSLLLSVIEQWKMLGETSVEGLQQSFIARNGVLRKQNQQWELEVETKPFDILIDHLPWSFSHIKLPWMDKLIFTKWR